MTLFREHQRRCHYDWDCLSVGLLHHQCRTMKRIITFFMFLLMAAAVLAEDARCYELRIYTAAKGKLEALNARFRDHTCKLFEKHGLTNVGYWVPADKSDNRLIYVISSPNRAAHAKSFKAFLNDPDWKKKYLSSHIEIDAHAHDGAEELVAVYDPEEIKDILRGKVDLSDRRLPNAISHYYSVLGPRHSATKKFMSKLYTQVQRMK